MSVRTVPEPYLRLDEDVLADRIRAAKEALGRRLAILGHHYQRDDVIEHADITGDSLKLARLGSERTDAEFLVFCGVHFMAESADILRGPRQTVLLPDLNAGCSMADMAPTEDVLLAGATLDRLGIRSVMPITYMNSTAELKAYCGERGGAVCTSSNARAIFEWGFAHREKIFFFPDEHLGRNTAARMGIPLESLVVWDPAKERGGLTADELERARVILWKGCCSVHTKFLLRHVHERRAEDPSVRILVHPEVPYEVAQAADEVGSTEHIIRVLAEAPAGSRWAVGTEYHLVNRLARSHPDKGISILSKDFCLCATMYRISPQNLLWVLESLLEGNAVNPIRVPDPVKHWAHVALDRMLEVH
ncbi:MAG: quinolinate synthase NadA [Candidatus Eisenbacteria bacterium]|uniref:Quinolinate synthase n=1 Tax=Eiseniibacteriota bacterium TaxID=2212470 RepID=A0A538SU60_UNCEI|nr:MAG: quinolinate synthase NadA [Candidatus Eisenbacteria bacterium]TMQ63696.1 MAG: quinolinate synthase NadA [Candidatus Eisenbacteria bacterium]